MENFPGNSHVSKIVPQKPEEPTAPEPKKPEVKPIAEGRIAKKTLGARFKDVFLTETTGFGDYLVKEVIIPGARDVFFGAIEHTLNGIKQGVERQIFGEVRSTTTRTSYGTGRPIKINYNGMSRSSATRPPSGSSRYGSPTRAVRRSNNVEGIILSSREECREVLIELNNIIERQGHCTVGDYYSCVNVRPTATDEQWGWATVDEATINKVTRDEFLLTLPQPEPIESEEL